MTKKDRIMTAIGQGMRSASIDEAFWVRRNDFNRIRSIMHLIGRMLMDIKICMDETKRVRL